MHSIRSLFAPLQNTCYANHADNKYETDHNTNQNKIQIHLISLHWWILRNCCLCWGWYCATFLFATSFDTSLKFNFSISFHCLFVLLIYLKNLPRLSNRIKHEFAGSELFQYFEVFSSSRTLFYCIWIILHDVFDAFKWF